MPIDRISSLDKDYITGDLSIYPLAFDSKDTLYDAKNNAESDLSHSLNFSADFILVSDTSSFPDAGLIRIENEIIYYSEKSTGALRALKRGFAGSQQNQHPIGSKVSHAVMAEPHNSCKDAIFNIENFLGIQNNPNSDSINGQLLALERKFLAPKPVFRAYPINGNPPQTVRFQNFSNQEAVRFLWDFGDGGMSTETNPSHTYLSAGSFTVQLTVVTSLGGNGIITKKDYIQIVDDKGIGFMYVLPEVGTTSTVFNFVDQTIGDIIQRHWSFGDGSQETEDDPDIHTITHTYTTNGSYDPTLIVVFADQSIKRVTLEDSILVH